MEAVTHQAIYAAAKRFDAPYVFDRPIAITASGDVELYITAWIPDEKLYILLSWQFMGYATILHFELLSTDEDNNEQYFIRLVSAR